MGLTVTSAPQTGSLNVTPATSQPSLSVGAATSQPTLSVAPASTQSLSVPQAPVQGPPDPVNQPLTTALNNVQSVAPQTKDISGTYANVNGTIYNKQTGQAYSNPQQFFQASGTNSFNGLLFDNNWNPTEATNASLNDAQQQAFDGLSGNPTSGIDQQQQLANQLINNAQTNQTTLTQDLSDATTGANDLRTQDQNYYNTLGIADLQQKINDAQSAYETIKGQEQTNLFSREDQYQGGGTEGFAQNLDSRDQRTMAVQELAASITLQGYQNQLNTQMDAFKTFAGAASDQQTHQISEISTQLGLNQQDLANGVSILNQVQQETQNNQAAGRQMFLSLVENIPGIASQLTPQETQALQNGQIPPSVVAKVGASQTYNDQQQKAQSASAFSNVLGNLINIRNTQGDSPLLDQEIASTIQAYNGALGNSGTSAPSSTDSGSSTDSLVSSNPNPAAVVAGYDLTSYAGTSSSQGTYGQDVASIYQNIPQISDAQSAQQYISSVVPNSPITGQMVMSAAQQYGVDPGMILAVAQKESSLGTAGMAVSTFNPGNVGNETGTRSSNLGSWQNGVNALAENLSKRQISQSSQSGQSMDSLLGSSGSVYGNATQHTLSGAKYIDTSLFSGTPQAQGLQVYAAANGVLPVSHDEATLLQNIQTARTNLSTLQNSISVLPTSKLQSAFGLNPAINKFLGTNGGPGANGPALSQWEDNLNTAGETFKTINDLSRATGASFDILGSNLPHASTTTQATAQAFINSTTNSLNAMEDSILGKNAPSSSQMNAAQLGGTPVIQGGV
jgi:hypothetical protein